MSASPSAERGNEWPRRNQMQQWTPAEHAIQQAVDAVEAMGADVRLTDAVILLGKARDRVADFVDGVEPTKVLRREHELRRLQPPGSPDAMRDGCRCPAIDNTHGYGAFMDGSKPVFWVNESCPLHGEKVAHV